MFMKNCETKYVTIKLDEYKELLYVYAEYQTFLAYQRQLQDSMQDNDKIKQKIGFEYKKGETSP